MQAILGIIRWIQKNVRIWRLGEELYLEEYVFSPICDDVIRIMRASSNKEDNYRMYMNPLYDALMAGGHSSLDISKALIWMSDKNLLKCNLSMGNDSTSYELIPDSFLG